MKILCISDIHGKYPYPKGRYDMILIAGDVLANFPDNVKEHHIQEELRKLNKFIDRCYECADYVIAVGGNHDLLFAAQPEIPKSLKWIYLEGESVVLDGVNIYGSPYNYFSPESSGRTYRHHGAFSYFPFGEAQLTRQYKDMERPDIFISHMPAYGILDVAYYNIHLGAYAVRDVIRKHEPALFVCGHIHESAGIAYLGNTKCVNAALSQIYVEF